jgi:pimeloyl-ACP methyl ester carboxylesterase
MWKNQVEYFSRNYYCITYDIRGLGEHPAEDVQFTIEDLVDQLEDVISDSRVNHPIICGLSMGGYIALRAVERNEANYRGLILCDTKSEPDNDEGRLKRAAAIKKINSEGIQKFAEGFITPLFAPESIERLGNEFVAILSRSMNSDPSGVKGCLLAMAARTSTTGYLQNIKIPVLVLSGEKDSLTPPSLMEQMALKIKGAEFHIIPGAGHLAPFEQPSVVNKLIIKFLSANAD